VAAFAQIHEGTRRPADQRRCAQAGNHAAILPKPANLEPVAPAARLRPFRLRSVLSIAVFALANAGAPVKTAPGVEPCIEFFGGRHGAPLTAFRKARKL
jgi:hypothetical protein